MAVKKIMKPFSTPVLSKRTYRELKLLKHLRHENVSKQHDNRQATLILMAAQVISLSDIFISPLEDMYGCRSSNHMGTRLMSLDTLSLSSWEPTFIAFSPLDRSKNSSSNTFSTRS